MDEQIEKQGAGARESARAHENEMENSTKKNDKNVTTWTKSCMRTTGIVVSVEERQPETNLIIVIIIVLCACNLMWFWRPTQRQTCIPLPSCRQRNLFFFCVYIHNIFGARQISIVLSACNLRCVWWRRVEITWPFERRTVWECEHHPNAGLLRGEQGLEAAVELMSCAKGTQS